MREITVRIKWEHPEINLGIEEVYSALTKYFEPEEFGAISVDANPQLNINIKNMPFREAYCCCNCGNMNKGSVEELPSGWIAKKMSCEAKPFCSNQCMENFVDREFFYYGLWKSNSKDFGLFNDYGEKISNPWEKKLKAMKPHKDVGTIRTTTIDFSGQGKKFWEVIYFRDDSIRDDGISIFIITNYNSKMISGKDLLNRAKPVFSDIFQRLKFKLSWL